MLEHCSNITIPDNTEVSAESKAIIESDVDDSDGKPNFVPNIFVEDYKEQLYFKPEGIAIKESN